MMISRHDSVLPLIESLYGEGDGPRSLGICRLDDIKLYKATAEKLPVLIKATSKFVEYPISQLH